MSKYAFTNNHFAINSSYLFLMRSGYAYKKFPLNNITKVEVKKGSKIKHPIRSVIFSVFLFWITFLLIPNKEFLLFDPASALYDISHLLVLIPEFLVMYGFLFAIALAILLQAVIPVPIVRFYLKDGSKFNYALRKFKKANQIESFNLFLLDHFGSRYTNKLLNA